MNYIDILLVEDNPSDVQLIQEYLEDEQQYDFKCFEADSLKTAFEILSHRDFDAVLLDLNLPDSAGLDTVRRIVNQLPDTAVVVLTGVDDAELALKAVRYGAQDFIEKSQIVKSTLAKSIRYAIERKNTYLEKEDLLLDLNQALDHIEILEKLLPLCVSCKKILGSDGTWYSLKECSKAGSPERPSELICPDCQTSFNTTSENRNQG